MGKRLPSRVFLLSDADRFPLDDDDRALLAGNGFFCIEMPGHDPDQLRKHGAEAEAVLVYSARITRSVLAGLPRCRVLARCGTGYDNIDLDAARVRKVDVTYVPDYGSIDVAEHALALMLACSRRLLTADHAVRAGQWPGYGELGSMRRLSGQVLGLIGFGRIARRLAERGAALGLVPIAYDPLLPTEQIRTAGAEPVGETEVLSRSDFLSLHLPLTSETSGWLDSGRLSQVKNTAILINTSRGEVVDETALTDALKTGKLSAAGLDVFADEPPQPDHPLLQFPQVVLSPHSAAFTEEALAEVRKTAIRDALAVLSGGAPRFRVPHRNEVGIELSSRGRVPADVIEKYRAAGN